MKKLLLFLFILFILSSCDYVPVTDVPDIGSSDDSSINIPQDGLNSYKAAIADDKLVPGRVVEYVPEMDDISLVINMLYSTPELFNEGFFNNLFSSLGLDLNSFFDRDHVKPGSRAMSFLSELHIENESVEVVENLNPIYSAKLDYLDLVASSSCGNLGKFIFRLIDRNEYPYNQKADGRLGFSTFIDLSPQNNKDYASLTFSSYVNMDLNDVYFNYVTINDQRIYIPASGTAHLKADISLASSIFTEADIHNSAEGFPLLDGSGYVTYKNYYCPYSLSISIKETKEFSCSSAFTIIRNLLMNMNAQSRDIYWNELTRLVWGSEGGEYITIELYFPDTGNGSSRTLKYTNFEAISYLLPS